MAMPALRLAPEQSDPETWLFDYDDQLLACRMGHDFPQLVPRRGRFPRTTIQRLPDEPGQVAGVVMITQRCSRCARVRWRLIGNHGLLEKSVPGAQWRYRDPKNYAQPKGMGLTQGRFQPRVLASDHGGTPRHRSRHRPSAPQVALAAQPPRDGGDDVT